MRLKNIIRAKKGNIAWGNWKSGVAMSRTQFPLSKGRNFRIRTSHRWCIVTFDCLGESFRLLIFYRMDKQEYGAYLAQVHGHDSQVLARLEFHGTHGGWHMHTNCETDHTPIGRTGGNVYSRIPNQHTDDRRVEFGITDDQKALYIAAKAFGLISDEDGLFHS